MKGLIVCRWQTGGGHTNQRSNYNAKCALDCDNVVVYCCMYVKIVHHITQMLRRKHQTTNN